MTTQPGETLNGRYELRRRLPGGGMGTVWEAYDTVLERRVVAKALTFEADDSDELPVMRERARREALALALVDHPAVVTVHDLIYAGDDPWIVMGFVEGQTLAQYVHDNPCPPEQEIASIGLVVLEGLLACHAKKVYHRDVKPANIIKTDGSARLVDFGIARIAGLRTLTPTSKVLGTPEFMAPELFKNQSPGQRTDLWALGATLYYAMEGRSPFAKSSIHATIGAIISDDPPEPPHVQGPLAALVFRMLRKRPSARPDAMVVLDGLRAIARGDAARRPGRRDKLPQQEPALVVPPDDTVRVHGAAARRPSRGKPLTWLSGLPTGEAARSVAQLPAERAIADLLALEDAEAAKILLACDGTFAGRLLSLAAAQQPAWTRKILEMVGRSRAGQFLDKMTTAASAAALARPSTQEAAQMLSFADDVTLRAVLSALSVTRPSRGAQLVVALDDLDSGRTAQALGDLEPLTVARLLQYVIAPARREGILGRLPWQFRPLVERHLKLLDDID